MKKSLSHYGIAGMKWGVRRSNFSKSSKEKIKTPVSEDSAAVTILQKKLKTGGVHSLSNKELQTVITRMNLEQQFSTLSNKNKSVGSKFIKEVAQNVMKQQLTKIASDYTTKRVGAAIRK